MHLPVGLLGGVLEGTLPNPGLSAEALIQEQVFRRHASWWDFFIWKPTYKAGGVVTTLAASYISGTGTAGVDNTAQTVVTVTVPANTLTQVGDRLRVRCYWRGDTGTPVTGSCSLNTVLISHTTDGGAATLQLNEVYLHYIDDTHANIIEDELGALGALSAVNVSGFSWSSSQDITLAQDQIVNNHIVVFAVIVDIFPKGSVV